MRGRQRVDRLRYSAPRGQGLDQRAAFKIVADQRFRRKANSQPRKDGGTHGLRTVRAEIAGDLDRRAGTARPLERPAVGRMRLACVYGKLKRLGPPCRRPPTPQSAQGHDVKVTARLLGRLLSQRSKGDCPATPRP
jgi:hypothetical protein